MWVGYPPILGAGFSEENTISLRFELVILPRNRASTSSDSYITVWLVAGHRGITQSVNQWVTKVLQCSLFLFVVLPFKPYQSSLTKLYLFVVDWLLCHALNCVIIHRMWLQENKCQKRGLFHHHRFVEFCSKPPGWWQLAGMANSYSQYVSFHGSSNWSVGHCLLVSLSWMLVLGIFLIFRWLFVNMNHPIPWLLGIIPNCGPIIKHC